MAAQPLPFVYYGEPEPPRARRPSRSHPRGQQTLEQPSTAMASLISGSVPLLSLTGPQSTFEAMIQPETNVVTSFARNSAAVVAEIDNLVAGREDEVKPSEYAYTRARSFVESAYGQVKLRENVPEVVPEASVTSDDMGGIRLAWRLGPKQVRANFGANDHLRSYIYFESNLEHHIEDLDVQRLAGGLDWLIKK